MKTYQFKVTLTLEAASEFAAKEKSEVVLSNLKEMCGYAPYSVNLELDKNSCEEVEFEDESVE